MKKLAVSSLIHVIRSGALRTAGTCASNSDQEYEALMYPCAAQERERSRGGTHGSRLRMTTYFQISKPSS